MSMFDLMTVPEYSQCMTSFYIIPPFWKSKYVILFTWDTCFLWVLVDLTTNLQCLLSEHAAVCVQCFWSQASSYSNYSRPPSDNSPKVSSCKPLLCMGRARLYLVSDATENWGREGWGMWVISSIFFINSSQILFKLSLPFATVTA